MFWNLRSVLISPNDLQFCFKYSNKDWCYNTSKEEKKIN
jgi:hypothetical protein